VPIGPPHCRPTPIMTYIARRDVASVTPRGSSCGHFPDNPLLSMLRAWV
jgi:hypothetical protein